MADLYADADSLVEVADQHRHRYAKAIREGIERVRGQASLDDIAAAFPVAADVLALYDWNDMLGLSFTVRKADPADADDLIAATMSDAAKLTYRLDMVSPFTVNAARRLAGDMVTSIDDASRKAIRAAITRGVAAELDRRQVARLIRSSVGLTRSQTVALANYRQALHDLMSGSRTSAQAIRDRWQLADARWSPRTLTPDRIDQLADRYSARLLRHRAENIAISETIRASNAGRVESWRQAIADGFLPADSLMVWRTVGDDRVCPQCWPMDGQVVGIVAGSQPFESTEHGAPGEPRKPVTSMVTASHPPLHTRCRCAVTLTSP